VAVWRNAPAAETRKNYGVATQSDGTVSEVVEKPADSGSLSCGMGVYVLSRSAIARFMDSPVDADSRERGITGGIQAAIDAGVSFQTFHFDGYYNNINSHSDVVAVAARGALQTR
jgi:dTDP-glucose pyrophosphorylase